MKSKSEMLVPRESEAEAAGVLAALDGMNEEQNEAAGVLAALDGMNEEQKRELLVFLDGVAFGQRLAETGPAA